MYCTLFTSHTTLHQFKATRLAHKNIRMQVVLWFVVGIFEFVIQYSHRHTHDTTINWHQFKIRKTKSTGFQPRIMTSHHNQKQLHLLQYIMNITKRNKFLCSLGRMLHTTQWRCCCHVMKKKWRRSSKVWMIHKLSKRKSVFWQT